MDTEVQGGVAAAQGIVLPQVGEALDGGKVAGVLFDAARMALVAVIDLGWSKKRMTHEAAGKWAADKGGRRPTRMEGILLADLDERTEKKPSDWFWLEPQYAGLEYCAWVQNFDVGIQNLALKSDDFRARAGRSVVIQSFGPSVIPPNA